MHQEADGLLNRILNHDSGSNFDVIANDLLREFFNGYPVTNLRTLLVSTDPEVRRMGIWIASELGAKGRPLLPDVVSLLDDEDARIRFDAIDCIVTYTTEADEAALGKAVMLIADPNPSVRWKATYMLFQLSNPQLRGALVHVEQLEAPHSDLAGGLRILLRADSLLDEDIVASLDSPSPTARRFGLAAAVRIAHRNETALRHATTSLDQEVAAIAQDELRDRVM